jgi:amino acid transporter
MDTPTLKHNSVGFWRVVFQGISASAPAAIVATITAASAYANGSLPLSFLIAFFGVLLSIVAIYEYSKKISSAGGYYAFVSRSSGPFAGIVTGMLVFGYQLTGLAFVPLYFTIIVYYAFAFFAGITIPAYLWVLVAIVTMILWSIPPYLGIKPSLNYSLILSTAEMVVLGIISFVIILVSGNSNSLTVYTPIFSPTGFNGVLLGGVFGITAFLGYGSVVTLGEEAKEPKRTIKKALLADVLIVGAFFVLFSYAFTIGWGHLYGLGALHNMSSFTSSLVPASVEGYRLIGLVPALLITFFGAESTFNAGLSFTTSVTRYLYAFSRDGHVLPKSLSKVHAKSGVPRRALIVSFISFVTISIVAGLTLGVFYGFVILAAAETIFALVIHIIVNSTVWRLYKGKERSILIHFIIPAVSSATFLYIIFASVYPVSYPIVIAPVAAAVWTVISVFLVIRARKLRREEYNKAGLYSSVE